MNVKTKTIDAAASTAGRSSGSVTSRNARHGDAPERGRRRLEVRRQVVPDGADGAHDDGEVEHDVGEQDRRHAALPARRGAGPSTAAPITTVGSTNADASSAPSSRRPGNAKRASTYAGASPTTTVSTVLSDAPARA